MHVSPKAGFSLLEALVAVTIFSLVSVASVTLLTQSVDSKEVLAEENKSIGQLQMMQALVKQDLLQLVPRPVRGGDVLQGAPSFAGGDFDSSDILLRFVRAGWSNPGGLPRSELQRVEYLVRDDQLVRRSWSYLDTGSETPVQERTLLDGVETVSLAFRQGDDWSSEWRSDSRAIQTLFPRALRFDIRSEGWGETQHMFLMPKIAK